jgi:hypothetical protein
MMNKNKKILSGSTIFQIMVELDLVITYTEENGYVTQIFDPLTSEKIVFNVADLKEITRLAILDKRLSEDSNPEIFKALVNYRAARTAVSHLERLQKECENFIIKNL